MDLKALVKNVSAITNSKKTTNSNAPSFYGDRQKQYFAAETKKYYENLLEYSSDFFIANVQSLNYEDFYEYNEANIRLSNAISVTSLTNLTEDFKQIMFQDSAIEYIGIGAKIETAGNTYIAVSPSNVSNALCNALVRKCNVLYNYLDYYGNIVSEPFCWTSSRGALATGPENQELMVIMNAYQHAVMQFNDGTKGFMENTRMVLGNQVYRARGVINFIQEFTIDPHTQHIIYFDLEIAEPSQYDDMENRVADGLAFNWLIDISGTESILAGETQQLTATSQRNGEAPTEPYSYSWSTSDESIATVDEIGLVTAISEGNCVITCALAENVKISKKFTLNVEAQSTESYVEWITIPPVMVEQYNSFTAEASYIENGQKTNEVVEYSFAGADGGYGTTINGNVITIEAYFPTPTPLTITAKYGDKEVTATVKLLGY